MSVARGQLPAGVPHSSWPALPQVSRSRSIPRGNRAGDRASGRKARRNGTGCRRAARPCAAVRESGVAASRACLGGKRGPNATVHRRQAEQAGRAVVRSHHSEGFAARQGAPSSAPVAAAPESVPAPRESPATPPPPLTLEQHASLCAELSFAPEKGAAILARYGLSAQAKALVDQFYRERVAQSAEVRAAWDRGYREYYAWLVNAATGQR